MDFIIEPLIGAVIGCFTNYIALKMLFRPYEPKRLFGKNLPFTPGLIPKRRKEIARAIGTMVERDLLDKKAVAAALGSEEITDKVADFLLGYTVEFPEEKEGAFSSQEMSVEGGVVSSPGKLVAEALSHLNIKEPVSKELYRYMSEKISGNLMARFVSDSLMQELAENLADKLESYLNHDGKHVISEAVDQEIKKLSGMCVEEILTKYGANAGKVRSKISDSYRELVEKKSEDMLEAVRISAIVEEKINAMDMRELEDMIFAVMKRELNAIVYLGALIGLLLGLLNLVI